MWGSVGVLVVQRGLEQKMGVDEKPTAATIRRRMEKRENPNGKLGVGGWLSRVAELAPCIERQRIRRSIEFVRTSVRHAAVPKPATAPTPTRPMIVHQHRESRSRAVKSRQEPLGGRGSLTWSICLPACLPAHLPDRVEVTDGKAKLALCWWPIRCAQGGGFGFD